MRARAHPLSRRSSPPRLARAIRPHFTATMPRFAALPRSAAAIALILAACTTMSTEKEAALGREASLQVAEQQGLLDDAELVRYVQELGARLAAHSSRKDVTYRFHVVDMEAPNAFALPGGYIYVSRGLLALTNDEAELAGVLGHEIAHVQERHAAERDSRGRGVGALATLGAVAGSVVGGAAGGRVMSQMGHENVAAYNRDQEREADRIGQRLTAQAGYDPAALPAFLRRLGKAAELQTGQTEMPTFLDSHPATHERVAQTAWSAPAIQVASSPPLSPTRAAYLARLVGLKVGPDPTQGAWRGRTFVHAARGFVVRMPSGWHVANQRATAAAWSPDGRAVLFFEPQRGTNEPERAAGAFARGEGLVLRSGTPAMVARRPAYRAKAQTSDSVALDLTWIWDSKGTFRIAGATAAADRGVFQPTFEQVVESFRPLSSEELSQLYVRQLYAVRARSGESLQTLSRRTDNAWSAKETAVMNGLAADERFQEAELVKIAVERPYRP